MHLFLCLLQTEKIRTNWRSYQHPRTGGVPGQVQLRQAAGLSDPRQEHGGQDRRGGPDHLSVQQTARSGSQ